MVPDLFGPLIAIGAFLIVIGLVVYVYMALVLMTIAKKTKTKNAWLAWIQIANIYLMTQVGGISGWWTALLAAGLIPIVGSIVLVVLSVYLWWKIAEARHRPGWWGILMILPVVNLVLMGVLAWGNTKK